MRGRHKRGRAIADWERFNNRSTEETWGLMAAHRNRVMDLVAAGPSGGRLLILGPGNCNDVDVPKLLRHFERLVLVDLDRNAVDSGLRRQEVAHGEAVRVRAPVDFASGTLALAPDADLLSGDATACSEQFEAVLSACVLSQLTFAAGRFRSGLGREHILAVRDAHLRMLIETLRPGGRAVLVSDFVSSDTLPQLVRCPPEGIGSLAMEAIRANNFFHGTNPLAIAQSLNRLSAYIPFEMQAVPPWRWDLGNRVYLVAAFVLQRK